MNPTQRLIIVDEQNQGGFFSKLIHAFALNVIVLFRHSFGYRFFSPIGYFLGHWICFAVLSALHYAITNSPATLALKCTALLLYFVQMVIAYLNFWLSRNPRHPDDAGISFFSRFLPFDEWQIHVLVEPLAAGLLGLILLRVDYTLGLLLLASGGALLIKDLRNYHEFRVKMMGVVGPLITWPNWLKRGGMNIPRTGGAYTPPVPAGQSAKTKTTPTLSFLPSVAKRAATTAKPPRIRPSQTPPLNGSNTPASVGVPPTPISNAQYTQAESEYVRLLEIPASGVKDLEHLKALWRQGLKIHHPDKTLDPAKKADAKVMTQKVNEAYLYFKTRIRPVGLQQPL